MKPSEMITCSNGCRAAWREDVRCGLIYGPYVFNGRFIGIMEYVGRNGKCVYCGGDLPRGRARRIMQRIQAAA